MSAGLEYVVQKILVDQEVSQDERNWLLDKVAFQIDDIALEYKKSLLSSKTGDELQRLKEVAALSRELQRKLSSLDEITQTLLLGELADLEKPRRFVGPVPAPMPSAATAREMAAQSRSDAVRPLEALAKAAEQSRDFLTRRARSQSGTGVRRGAGNLHDHVHGDLRARLTYQLALLLGQYQGMAAVTTTEGGKLHCLATAAWECAIGSESDAVEGGLYAIAKRVAPIARQVLEARQRFESGPELDAAEREALRKLRQPPPRRR